MITSRGPGLSLRAKLWLSHGGALAAGLVVATLMSWRFTRTEWLDPSLERTPLSDAATLAYQWGSAADAGSTLRQYSALLGGRTQRDEIEVAERFFARIRLGIVEGHPRSELLRICAERPACKPEKFELLVAKVASERQVTSVTRVE